MSFDAVRWAMQQPLPCTEKMVLVVLADAYNGRTGQCNLQKSTIARRAGVNPRTADRALIRLREHGLVEFFPSRGRASNDYRLKITGEKHNPGTDTGLSGSNPGTVTGLSAANPGTESANPGTESIQPRHSAGGTSIEPGKNQGESARTREANAQHLADPEGTRSTEGVNQRSGVRPAARVRRGKRATPAPDHFPLTDKLTAWGAENAPGIDLPAETERFLDYHRAKGSTFRDWSAAWRNWVRRAVEYRPGRPQTTSDGQRDPYELADHRGMKR